MRINRKKFNQYFTPIRVARFMMRLIKQINPDISRIPGSFMDPACGEGAFLEAAMEENITTPPLCHGIDKDGELVKAWDESGITSLLKNNISISDALFTDIAGTFRIVAGNPPFSSIPLKPEDFQRLQSFEIFRNFLKKRKLKAPPPSFPIEILFLERFIQLTEPGGMIAIVLPEGIPANSKMDYVRDFVNEKCRLNAIISPKPEIFTKEGTGAMTCLLFLTKKNIEEESGLKDTSPRVLMAAPNFVDLAGNGKDDLSIILERFPHFGNNMDDHSPAWWVPFSEMKDSRWDPGFHSPEYTGYLQNLKKGRYPLVPLRDLMGEDRIFTADKGVQKRAVTPDRVRYITSRQITETGIDLTLHDLFIDRNGTCDPERTRIRNGDILFVRSGDGCIGRAVVAGEESEGNNIRSEIYILRPDPEVINPCYLALFFNMFKVMHKKHGVHFQLKKLLSGVGTPNLSKSEILSVMIPNLPMNIQKELEMEYRSIRDKNNAYVREKMKRSNIQEGWNGTAGYGDLKHIHSEVSSDMKSLMDKVMESGGWK